MVLKTGYEWCLENRIKPLNLSQWTGDKFFSVKDFYVEKINSATFMEKIQKCDVQPNCVPQKTNMFLEYKIYGLVASNISPVQQGIQFAHALVEYQQNARNIPPFEQIYNKWALSDKSFTILNGGTTSENPKSLGTLQRHAATLVENDILIGKYYNSELNDALTAIVFLADERVFKKDLFPSHSVNYFYSEGERDEEYQEWLLSIGGKQNEFLRNFLSGFKTI